MCWKFSYADNLMCIIVRFVGHLIDNRLSTSWDAQPAISIECKYLNTKYLSDFNWMNGLPCVARRHPCALYCILNFLLTRMAGIPNGRIGNHGIIVFEKQWLVFADNGCVSCQIDWALLAADATLSAPFLVICKWSQTRETRLMRSTATLNFNRPVYAAVTTRQ